MISHLSNSVAGKMCSSSVNLVEKEGSTQGLDCYWTLKCTNEQCHMTKNVINVPKKFKDNQ